MSTSLYDLTVPVLVRGLRNLSAILAKGEAHAREQDIDPATLIEARLFPDMGALASQIQRASDSAKGCVVRLGEAIDGQEEREVVLQTPSGSFPFKGRDFALGFVLPNVFFHITTAYAILRHKGAPLGKFDYLGGR